MLERVIEYLSYFTLALLQILNSDDDVFGVVLVVIVSLSI